MLIVQQTIEPVARWEAELELPFEDRTRSRLRTRVRSGEEIGLFLDRGTVLRHGDCLRADDGRVVKVFAATEDLHEASCADAQSLARAAYHLGNRHAHVQVLDGVLRFAADAVLAQMLEGIGVTVRPIVAPFDPEPGAYAGGGHHHSGEARHAGRIHDFAGGVGDSAGGMGDFARGVGDSARGVGDSARGVGDSARGEGPRR